MSQGSKRLRLAVLVSGSGTNLQALLNRAEAGELAAEVVVVASDRADAHGLVRAQSAGIPAHVVDYRAFLRAEPEVPSLTERVLRECSVDIAELERRQKILRHADPRSRRERLARLVLAEHALIQVLDGYQPDCVCLAGFMRLLTPFFLSHYNKKEDYRVVNIHPALLPAFPGQHGYEETFEYGCKWGGITVHFADEGEDSGPIIAQAVYPIWPDEGLERVRQRGLRIEYDLYAQCINWIAAGQVLVQRGEDGRSRVAITDPAYRDILRAWLAKAMLV
jgi:phosphoribosylglycinamide formyltransferase 1